MSTNIQIVWRQLESAFFVRRLLLAHFLFYQIFGGYIVKDKIIVVIAVVLMAIFLVNCFSCGTCSSDKDGGKCKFCGDHTNWTYRSGGYVCYTCYKRYYK